MLSRAVIIRLAMPLLALAGLASCSRRTLGDKQEAGSEAGGPSVSDGGRVDAPAGDVAADLAFDVAFDVPFDGVLDTGRDLPPDSFGADASDGGVDVPAAVCPAAVPPLDVCGCGCCGGVESPRACYYPALGQSRDTIPNPMPTPQECATTGCSEGVHYVCCADPGPDLGTHTMCGIDTSIEDQGRFAITRRDGEVCTTLELGGAAALPGIAGPPGRANANAWRGPCDGSAPLVSAFAGSGSVTPGTSSTLPRYDVHVVLYFDVGTGVADAVRIDQDEVGISPRCASVVCPVCGAACAFDATYRFTTNGGFVASRDAAVLSPPASYTHTRQSAASNVVVSCSPAIPACGGSAIDVADLMAAFTDADVQDAFTRSIGAGTLPFYGQDQRGSDGAAYQITRDGGGGFLVGAPCPAGSTPSSCMAIPGGVSRLVSLLVAFDRQQLADPSCAALAP